MRLAAGTKLDGYEVLGLLGAGGMGEVYRARDPSLKREVAIKVLPSFVSRDPDRLHRFEQEAQAAAALNHPNILAVYQFGAFEGAPYLVSELLEGSTLRQVLQRAPLRVRKAIDYGVQIAHGLAAAHEKGIVHRDLKPENLFVAKDGRIKILDFGLAKLKQHPSDSEGIAPTQTLGTDPGVVMGTAGYMSPEQVRGQTVDHRTDIFAFGAILYEMLAGKRAFQRSTSAETMTAILNDDPPAISQIVQTTPPGLQRVVHRCLEKNPEQRFQSASDLAFALEAVSESGASPTVVNGGKGQRRPGRLVRWLACLVGILSLAVVAYFFMTRRKRVPFEHFTIQRVGDSERVELTAISPDGMYLASVVRDVKGTESLWVHHIPTSSERAILQDAAFKYDDVIFSPDSSYIYFLLGGLGILIEMCTGYRFSVASRSVLWRTWTPVLALSMEASGYASIAGKRLRAPTSSLAQVRTVLTSKSWRTARVHIPTSSRVLQTVGSLSFSKSLANSKLWTSTRDRTRHCCH
jgi:serine/threonine protein kinase